MVNQKELRERTKDKPSLDEITTVIWTRDMGQRLALARMRMLTDQREFARLFEKPLVNQGTISRLELGRLPVTDRITISDLKRVLGALFMFVVFGSNPERFNANLIHQRYWNTRLRIRRKNQSAYSKGRLL